MYTRVEQSAREPTERLHKPRKVPHVKFLVGSDLIGFSGTVFYGRM